MNSDFIAEDLTTDGHGWTRIFKALTRITVIGTDSIPVKSIRVNP
jgi:hypothetical protein